MILRSRTFSYLLVAPNNLTPVTIEDGQGHLFRTTNRPGLASFLRCLHEDCQITKGRDNVTSWATEIAVLDPVMTADNHISLYPSTGSSPFPNRRCWRYPEVPRCTSQFALLNTSCLLSPITMFEMLHNTSLQGYKRGKFAFSVKRQPNTRNDRELSMVPTPLSPFMVHSHPSRMTRKTSLAVLLESHHLQILQAADLEPSLERVVVGTAVKYAVW